MSQPPRAPLDLRGRMALRPREAAEALGISERKFREVLPELPVVRHGGVVVIPVDGLREWLRSRAEIEGNRVAKAVEEVVRDFGIDDE